MTTTDNLRIDHPCPFVPKKGNKDGDNYFCKSCNKTIIDFRSKAAEEIKFDLNKDTCGIFNVEQLPGQQQMKLSRQFMFYCLSILSILGFTVKPLNAQTPKPAKDSVTVNIKTTDSDSTRIDKVEVVKTETTRKKRKSVFRRKKKYTVTGCPSF
jgi:hypothetical protein